MSTSMTEIICSQNGLLFLYLVDGVDLIIVLQRLMRTKDEYRQCLSDETMNIAGNS